MLRGLGASVGVAALTIMVLAWRLSRGPLDVSVLTPVLERALARPEVSLAVRIGATELAWAARDWDVELRARDVRLLSHGEPVVVVPTVLVELSAGALLRGAVEPRAVELRGVRLTLVRSENGAIGIASADGVPHPVTFEPKSRSESSCPAIELREGQLSFLDRVRGDDWQLHGVEFDLECAETGIAARLAGHLALAATLVPVRLDGVYHPETASAAGTLAFVGLELPALATRANAPSFAGLLSRLRLPLDGSLAWQLDTPFRLRHAQLSVDGAGGVIAAPELPAREVPVERVRVRASLQMDERVLAVDEVLLDLGEPRLTGDGRMRLDDARNAEARVTLGHAAVTDLLRYWPETLVPSVRAWIASSITAGHVHDGRVQVRGRVPDAGHPEVDAVSGSVAFSGTRVRLPDRVPPASGLSGTATFDPATWNVTVTRGTLAGLEVVHASAKPAPRSAGAGAVIRGRVSGPLARALALIETSRPGVTAGLGVPLAEVSGTLSADVETSVGLGRAPDPAELPLEVSARLRDVSVPHAFRGQTVAARDLVVELRRQALAVRGDATIAGAPATIVWREPLGDPKAIRQLDVRGRVDANARAALGFDLRPWLDGPADVRATIALAGGTGTIDLFADLAASSLSVPGLTPKPPGAAGRAEAHLAVVRSAVTRVERALVSTEGAELRGAATLSPAHATVTTLDAQAIVAPVAPATKASHVALTVRPGHAGHAVVLTADDSGALLRAIEPRSVARGGQVRFEGSVRRGAGVSLDGHLQARDVTILQAPLLARLVTLTSPRGLMKSPWDDGISFRQITTDIRHRDTTITLSNGVAKGPELGLLVAGTIDDAAKSLDLRGTLVPSYYGLNTLGSRVPLVGGLLTGSTREGLQTFDFRITGPIASPRVSVNPVSGLVPGALRDVRRRRRPDG